MLKEEHIVEVLRGVDDPERGQDIVSLGMVSGVQVSSSGDVVFMIEVDSSKGAGMEPLRQRAEKIVASLKGVKKVTAVLTAERTSQNVSNDAYDHKVGGTDGVGAGHNAAISRAAAMDPHGMGKNPPLSLPIKKIICVASGKGGVGKSSISSALAKNLAKNSQLKIGLLDADIYGPSQIILSGLEAKKPEFSDKNMIIPPRLEIEGNAYGLKVMSIGFMVDSNKALVWRGPMVQSAIYQLFRDVQWADENEELDILIVDMPPGTGDAQLTVAQKIAVDGAIIISTPQDLALADARKGVEMFNTTGVPIIGLIENMSTHICTKCGHEEHIFGHGGAAKEAEKLGIPFLGEIPLSLAIREACDAGQSFDLPAQIVESVRGLL